MKVDVYQQVTDRILAALEEGTVPWHKPWRGGGPVNVRNGRLYRGINVFLLELAGYGDPRWGTFKAVKEAAVAHARSEGREIVAKVAMRKGFPVTTYYEVVGGKEVLFRGGVRKGEHGTHVILWKPVKKKHPESEESEEKNDSYILLRDFVVFNVEQTDGLPALPDTREHEPIEEAEALVTGYIGPTITHGGGQASYSETLDQVRVPVPENFESGEAYYATLFHELVHSTGHESRLNRLEHTGFGTGPYAKEELVAEMGAAMLCGVVGIEPLIDQSAAYIANWLERLQNDRKLAVQAAALAQRGCDLIRGTTFDSQASENQDEPLAVAA